MASSARRRPRRAGRRLRVVGLAFDAVVPRADSRCGRRDCPRRWPRCACARRQDEVGERHAVMRRDEVDRSRLAAPPNTSDEPASRRRQRCQSCRGRRARNAGRRRGSDRSIRGTVRRNRRADSHPAPISHGSAISTPALQHGIGARWRRSSGAGRKAVVAAENRREVEAETVDAGVAARNTERVENESC